MVTRREGREKHDFLNPVPIRLIHDRWIDKYAKRRVSALADLKTRWGTSMTWNVPTDVMHFTKTFVPRSVADVLGY